MLVKKAINSVVTRLYEAGDQDDVALRLPEVGSNATFEDGREFVFCSTDSDITIGTVVGKAAGAAELTSITAAVSSGETEVSFVLASVTEDQYAGGYLTVTLGTGIGHTYKIKGNTASATVDEVDNTVVVTLADSVVTDMAATDNIVVKTARTKTVVEGTATTDPVGVAMATTTAATSGKTQYFWAQIAGVGIVPGTAGAANVALSPAASGGVAAADGTSIVIATGLVAGASNSVVDLCFPAA